MSVLAPDHPDLEPPGSGRPAVDPRSDPADLPSPAVRARFRRAGDPAALHAHARALAARPALWRSQIRFSTATRFAVRIGATEDSESWLLTWLPGQSTGWHDHGGSAGAFTVVGGTLRETSLGSDAIPRSRLLGRGDVRAFDPHYVHDVATQGDEVAVSVHVYSPALEGMRRYALDDARRLRVVAVEEAGVDW